MEGCIAQALLEFQHAVPENRHHAPSRRIMPKCGAKVQCTHVDNSESLNKAQMKFAQKVVGEPLNHARAVDPTVLHAVNNIFPSASKGTEETLKATVHSLDFASTHPDAEVICRASDTMMQDDSDTACLVAPEAGSRAGGCERDVSSHSRDKHVMLDHCHSMICDFT